MGRLPKPAVGHEDGVREDLLAINHWLSLTRLRAAAALSAFAIGLQLAGIDAVALLPTLTVCGALALFSAPSLSAVAVLLVLDIPF